MSAATCGALFLYISTDYVFDGRNPPYGEDDSPNPLNVYGRSKLEGERETLRHCPGTSVTCLSLLSLACPSVTSLTRDPARCGGTAGARSVWGGGVGDGERGDVVVPEGSGGVRGELHAGSRLAEIPH